MELLQFCDMLEKKKCKKCKLVLLSRRSTTTGRFFQSVVPVNSHLSLCSFFFITIADRESRCHTKGGRANFQKYTYICINIILIQFYIIYHNFKVSN